MAKIIKEVSLPGVAVSEKFVIAVFDTREEAIEKISDFKKFMIGEDVVSIGDGAIMLYSKGKTISIGDDAIMLYSKEKTISYSVED